MITRLLFATDFSECARQAEEYVACIATTYGATIDVLHVLELYPGMNPEYPVNTLYLAQLRSETDRELAATVERLQRRKLIVAGQQVIGIPSARICTIAGEGQADLIVVGTRGRTGLEHIVLGSTAERVVATAPCPVLTVRTSNPTPSRVLDPIRLRRLLIPVDFSDCSLGALEYGTQVAKKFGATLTIVHVLEPVSYGLDFTVAHPTERERLRDRIFTELDGVASAIKAEGLGVDYLVKGGMPADSILDLVGTSMYDLIVMGTHGRRGVSHAMRGSVAEAVLRRARCPVLTVKSPKFAPGYRRIIRLSADRSELADKEAPGHR